MEIVIDINAPAPLFTQLVEQVKQAVLSEKMAPGDALPSIRQLAADLELNNKTVAKAYRLLERDSVIETKGYRGTFIHAEAKTNSTVDMSTWVTTTLTATISSFQQAGVTDSEIRIAFGNIMNNRSSKG
ncbi:MAG: GntR family transcriptional regulator [Kordiimonadales bacterium]|nr:MAG: GntR family transcriptional regulator [Kordiimonadales bacterium]